MHDHSRFQRDINDVTGVSLSLSLSLPLTKVTDAQYRKRFRASYNEREREREGGGGSRVTRDELENELAGRSTLNQRHGKIFIPGMHLCGPVID